MHARGPMFNAYLEQLSNECNNIWQNGRQLCESVSLTGQNCVNETHRVPSDINPYESESRKETNRDDDIENNDENYEEDRGRNSKLKSITLMRNTKTARNSSNNSRNEEPASSRSKPTIKNHNSNIVLRAASNCGEFQRDRKDPFDLKEANFTFYDEFTKMEFMHKRNIIKHEFEVFKPSTPNVKPSTTIKYESELEKPAQTTQNNFSIANLSQDSKAQTFNQQKTSNPNSFSSLSNENQQNQSNDDSLSRSEGFKQQASTEVFLSGMTHSENPPGLLPLFSSWSLVSIGKYSDYNAHSGLAQPGFLSNQLAFFFLIFLAKIH